MAYNEAVLGFDVRAGEADELRLGAQVLALTGAAAAMVASASDALFMARVGVRQLGTAFAVSSALLVIILGYVGAIADRTDRARLLVRLVGLACVIVGAFALCLELAPATVSTLLLVLGKQLSAAIELAFWVLVAERFDARQARRLVPIFVLAQGAGVAVGAFAVAPVAGSVGAHGVLVIAAALYGAAAFAALGFARGALGRPVMARARPRSTNWGDGLRAVRGSPLASRLAVLVGVAGVFAPVLYYLLSASAAGHFSSESAVAGFLGQYRGAVQLTILVAALAAPGLIARVGVAPALLAAPLVAVAAVAGLAVSTSLLVVALARASSRVVDAAIETPTEKLVQNLVPSHLRGRVHGAIDGVAKRAGAIIGGLLASALIVWPSVLVGVTAAIAVLWLVIAWWLRRDFANLAVAELVAGPRRARERGQSAGWLVDERGLRRLRASIDSGGHGRALATELLLEFDAVGRVDAVAELAEAAVRAAPQERTALLRVLDELTQRRPRAVSSATRRALVQVLEQTSSDRAQVVTVLGRVTTGDDPRVERSLRALLGMPGEERLQRATELALARIRGDVSQVQRLIKDCLADGDDYERSMAMVELRAEIARSLGKEPPDWTRAVRGGATLLRALRRERVARAQVAGIAALSDLLRSRSLGDGGAELVLLAADAGDFARRVIGTAGSGQRVSIETETGGDAAPASVRAAAVELLSATHEADVQLFADLLGDADESVRRSAADALRGLGENALEALLIASNFGRRHARNAALEIIADLRVRSDALDELIERELSEISHATARLAPLYQLADGDLLCRRVMERVAEAAHTLLLALEARLGQPAIGAAARRFLRARSPTARARALEALDAVLPRELGRRVLAVLDAGAISGRSARAARQLGVAVPTLDAAIDAELSGTDAIARSLAVHLLDASGRAKHRAAITAAAESAVREFDPKDLLLRIRQRDDTEVELLASVSSEGEDEMPTSVETIIALGRLPIFSELSSRQLADLAEVVQWQTARDGDAIVEQGHLGEAMYFLLSGRAEVSVRSEVGRDAVVAQLGAGDLFGEMALFEDTPRSATVRAVARCRLGRIERAAFEELVEDVPGVALAVCRVLSRRIRRQNQAAA